MRAHKGITELKEIYHYDFTNIDKKDIENISQCILRIFGVNRIRTPIIDIANKLGFTVYNIPFEKEECSEDIKGMLGVGIEFSMNENSNFILIEKNMEDVDKRFFVAYLLAYYILNIDERSTDYHQYRCNKNSLSNTAQTRLALSLLMPKDIFKAQLELLNAAYIVNDKQLQLNKKFIIHKLAKTFQVTDNMVKARMMTLECI